MCQDFWVRPNHRDTGWPVRVRFKCHIGESSQGISRKNLAESQESKSGHAMSKCCQRLHIGLAEITFSNVLILEKNVVISQWCC